MAPSALAPLSTPAPTSVPPTPVPQIDPSLTTTPLGSFLLEISPSFLSILPNLPHGDIPLSTDPTELFGLDDGEIWDLFGGIEGANIAHCAFALAGIKQAKSRHEGNPSAGKLNPKIVQGLNKVKVGKWIKRRIDEGERMTAQLVAEGRDPYR